MIALLHVIVSSGDGSVPHTRMQIIILLFLMALPGPGFANQGAPVLLWKSNFNGATLPDFRELSSTEAMPQLHGLLNSMETEVLVLFLMNELNVEDFSGHPEALPKLQRDFESCEHVFKPTMPSLQVESLSHNVVTVNATEPSSVLLPYGDLKTALLVRLHDRPAADRRTALQTADTAIGQILDSVKRLSGSYVAVLTGRYTSERSEAETRNSRDLQAVDPRTPASQQHLFLNFGCVLFYTSGFPVIHFQSVKETTGPQALLLLPLGAPSSSTCSCIDGNVNIVTIRWQHVNSTSVDLAGVTLKLLFKAKMMRPGGNDLSSWTLDNVTVSYAGTVDGRTISKAEVEIDFDEVYAPRHFSYHCTSRLWAAEPTAGGADSDGPALTALQLTGFQVQPFLADGAPVRFGRPWDCTTMVTIPILSGLLLSLLLLVILVIALMMLANIPANDRFDDPHGKLLLAHLTSNE